jgi:DNA-binding winged helix-turn-helix (wHTH) protein
VKEILKISSECSVDFNANIIIKNHEKIPFTGMYKKLLEKFADNIGIILSLDVICSALWPDSAYESESSLTDVKKYISQLRKFIGDANHTIIQTRRGDGYVFCVDKPESPSGDGHLLSETAEGQKIITDNSPQKIDGDLSVIEGINKNSKAYFNEFKKANRIDVKPEILPKFENQKDDEKLCDVIMQASDSLVLIQGEGGVGKSYVLFECCEELFKENLYVPLYIPMKKLNKKEDYPILQYSYEKYFIGVNNSWNAALPKQPIHDLIKSGENKLVFILDGLNEYSFNADSEQNKSLVDEIAWLTDNKVKVVISSRSKTLLESNGNFNDIFALKLKAFKSDFVKEYLKDHENTKGKIDVDAKENARFIELLNTPLMLSLFAETYSPIHALNKNSIQKAEKHSDILKLCVDYQINRLNNDNKARFTLKTLFPLVTLGADIKNDLEMEVRELMDTAQQELKTILNDELFWAIENYDYDEFNSLTSKKNLIYTNLIKKPMLENAVFLREDDNNIVSWEHQLFKDFFVSAGIVLKLKRQPKTELKIMKDISEDILSSQEKADGLISVAVFLYEMLENEKEICDSFEFILLLSAIARTYSDMKDGEKTRKFAELVLTKIEKMEDKQKNEYLHLRLRFAEIKNRVAYTILEVKDCFVQAEKHINEALIIVEEVEKSDSDDKVIYDDIDNIKLIKGRIKGNMGACFLSQYKKTKELNLLEKALESHNEGLKIKLDILHESKVSEAELAELYLSIGAGYNSLGTDYYYFGEDKKSLEKHEEAIKFFGKSFKKHQEAIKFREKGNKDIRKVEGYIRCIGTLINLLDYGGDNTKKYLDEILSLFKKGLMLDSNKNYQTLSSLNCLLRNTRELKDFKAKCEKIIQFTKDNPNIVSPNDKAVIRETAVKINKLYDEVLPKEPKLPEQV